MIEKHDEPQVNLWRNKHNFGHVPYYVSKISCFLGHMVYHV